MFHSIKNAPRRNALRRKRSISPKRPASGGESCEQDFFYRENNISYTDFSGMRNGGKRNDECREI